MRVRSCTEEFTEEEVRALLRALVRGIGNQRMVAERMNISQPFLSAVLAGRRRPQGKILAYLRLTPITIYMRVKHQ